MIIAPPHRLGLCLAVALLALAGGPASAWDDRQKNDDFQQVNLVSDLPGVAILQDTNLVNAWGMSFSGTSPFWISDNGSGLSTLYAVTYDTNGVVQVAKQGLQVSIPGEGSLTGQLFNNTPAFHTNAFIFASEDGIISGWHGLIGTTNFSRNLYPEHRVNLQLEEPGGRALADLHHPGLTLSDLALRTQGTLLAGEAPAGGAAPWAVAVRADLKLPVGRPEALGGSGGVDGGLGLAATWAPKPWLTLHWLGDVRLISPLPDGFPLQPRTVQWGLDFSGVLRLGAVALVGEGRLSSRLFRGGWSLQPREIDPQATAYYGLFCPYNQLSAGVRFSEVTVYFSEDFTLGRRLPTDDGPPWFYNSNSPDIVLGVAWARKL